MAGSGETTAGRTAGRTAGHPTQKDDVTATDRDTDPYWSATVTSTVSVRAVRYGPTVAVRTDPDPENASCAVVSPSGDQVPVTVTRPDAVNATVIFDCAGRQVPPAADTCAGDAASRSMTGAGGVGVREVGGGVRVGGVERDGGVDRDGGFVVVVLVVVVGVVRRGGVEVGADGRADGDAVPAVDVSGASDGPDGDTGGDGDVAGGADCVPTTLTCTDSGSGRSSPAT